MYYNNVVLYGKFKLPSTALASIDSVVVDDSRLMIFNVAPNVCGGDKFGMVLSILSSFERVDCLTLVV